MPLAIVHSRAQTGIESSEVAVEVDLAAGLPSLSIVGLAETAVKESKDRVRSAIVNAVAHLLEVTAHLGGGEPLSPVQQTLCSSEPSGPDLADVRGGSLPRPGEVSLAHNGVLFLDELPEFGARVLDQLREPLQTGEVHISRVARQQRYPASFQLVAAMNLCRCGRLGDPRALCQCSPEQVRRYQERVSGPLLDRIDIQVHVKPVDHRRLAGAADNESSTAVIGEAVCAAIEKQHHRQARANAMLAGRDLESVCAMDEDVRGLLGAAMERLSLSARAYHRILRVARTIADLDAADRIGTKHVAEAIQYRTLEET